MRIQRVLLAGIATAVLGAAGQAAWAQDRGVPADREPPKADRHDRPDPPPPHRIGEVPRDRDADGQPPRRPESPRPEGRPGDRRPPRDGEGPRGDGPPPPPRGADFEGRGPGPNGPGPGFRGGEGERRPPQGRPGLGPWEDAERRDPEMAKLVKQEMEIDAQTRELVDTARQAKGADRDAIKAKLKEAVAKHFELRQQRRQLELERLEKELKRLREAIDNRKKASAEIIDRRVSELLGQPDDFGF